jgi:hypothetical protein
LRFGVWGRATIRYRLFSFNVPEKGVIKVYILVFNLEKSLIVSGTLPQLIPFTAFDHISPFGSKAQTGFNILNKGLAPHGNTASPFVLALLRPISQVLLYPPLVASP